MKIVFTNNGSYENHGCEAIIKGSVALFNQSFENNEFKNIAHFKSGIQTEEHNQLDNENIQHVIANSFNKNIFTKIIGKIIRKVSNKYFSFAYKNIQKEVSNSDLILSVGGDNYSFDYGYPYPMTNLDNEVKKSNTKMIIWGASIGPFTEDKQFEHSMIKHLSKFDLICIREDESYEYLKSIGVKDNIFRSSDPAFFLSPKKTNFIVKGNTIGLNFSPLIMKYSNNEEYEILLNKYVDIVKMIIDEKNKNVLLIPHVNKNGNNDYDLLLKIYDRIKDKTKVDLVGTNYDAEELKYIISKCEIFIGARTHATIAAFSTNVPTISLSYSIKAIGLNKKIFGSLNYVIDSKIVARNNVSSVIDDIYLNYNDIKDKLEKSVIKERELLLQTVEKIKAIL